MHTNLTQVLLQSVYLLLRYLALSRSQILVVMKLHIIPNLELVPMLRVMLWSKREKPPNLSRVRKFAFFIKPCLISYFEGQGNYMLKKQP